MAQEGLLSCDPHVKALVLAVFCIVKAANVNRRGSVLSNESENKQLQNFVVYILAC